MKSAHIVILFSLLVVLGSTLTWYQSEEKSLPFEPVLEKTVISEAVAIQTVTQTTNGGAAVHGVNGDVTINGTKLKDVDLVGTIRAGEFVYKTELFDIEVKNNTDQSLKVVMLATDQLCEDQKVWCLVISPHSVLALNLGKVQITGDKDK